MAGPPWLDPERQQAVTWRDGDIVISVPVKSGTNWMMNVVHQLLTGGDAEFESIYDVVPWPEFVERPGQPVSEVTARLDAMPTDVRRTTVLSRVSVPPKEVTPVPCIPETSDPRSVTAASSNMP